MAIKYELYLETEAAAKTSGDSELSRELDQIQFDDSIIRGEDDFKQYRIAAQRQYTFFQTIVTDGSELAHLINELINRPNVNGGKGEVLAKAKQLTQSLMDSSARYVEEYQSPGSIIATWEARLMQNRDVSKQLRAYEQQFQEASSVLDTMKSVLTLDEQMSNIQARYDELANKYEGIKRYNTSQSSDINVLIPSGNGSEKAKQSTMQLSHLLALVSNAAQEGRDTVYVNEYSLQRFSSFPFGELESVNASLPTEWFDVAEQEVEYILYGVHEPLANVLIAFGEIFAIRFAIRTIEGFIANRALSHPLLILAAAVVHGMQHAASDMSELLNEGKTKLSKYAPIDVSYPQYLRLFLLLHATGASSRLSRMIALIELETGLSLMHVPTSVMAHAQLSMQLWSFPGIANLTNLMNGMGSEVEGNVYKKYEMVSASY